MKKKLDNSQAAELRRQAEAKLSERKKKAAALPGTKLDTQRLVHELEVHQIELEMQNEELMQSRAQVEAGLRQYTDLYDFAPIGYFTLASDGTIHQVNLAGANLLGVERGALIKRRFGAFVSTESRSIFNAFLEKVFGSQLKETCEVAFQNNGSTPLWVHIEATSSAVLHGEREACRVVVVDIAERKHAEELQNETERVKSEIFEKLNEAQHFARIGSWEWNLRTNHVWWSDETYRIFGVTPQDYVPSFEANGNFIYPDDFAKYNKEFEHSLHTGEPLDFDTRLVTKDGVLKYCQAKGKIVFDDSGKPIRFIGMIMDITERTRSEEKLKKSEDKYRSIFENVQDVYYETSFDGTILEVNPSIAIISKGQYHRADLIGKSMYDFYPDTKDRDTLITAIQKTGSVNDYEIRLKNRDGFLIPCSISANTIFNAEGRPEKIVGSMHDISERKKAEDEVRKLSRAVEQSGSSITITNLKGEIEYVNPKFCGLTGYTIQESMGKNPRILKSGKTSSEEYRLLWDTITSGQVWRGEFHNKKKNGELYWESATISPIKDIDGKITHFIAVKEDVTQQKAMADELRQMQKLEGLGTLAGGIAHDFNNILGIILAYNSNIKKLKDDSKKLDLATETITKAVYRGKTLVQQILMFARKTETAFGAVNVNDVVMEIVTMIYEMFPKTVTCSQNFDKSIHYINADRSQLHQVLMNLCVNARDAMPKGGVLAINTRMVSVASLRNQHPDAAASSYVCIEVSDTGEGMTPETQKRIFEPFFTTKGIGKGTGLGLSVTFGVIQTHKGFIDVESDLGKGTTFRVYLPASQVVEPIRETKEKTLDEMPGGTETLLVVEDEEMLLTSLQMLLEDKGYNILSAKDGLTALKIYQKEKNDIALIITDLGLPNITGLEVCQRIKEINPNEHIILASGYIDPEMKAELLKTDVKRFLYKPYNFEEILKLIRNVLDEK